MSGANISTKRLVLPLQTACSGTTRCLYGDYKVLVRRLQGACTGTTRCCVLSLQAVCSACTKGFLQQFNCCCAGMLVAKWGGQTNF